MKNTTFRYRFSRNF